VDIGVAISGKVSIEMQIQIEQKRAKEAKGEKGRMRPSNQSLPLLATIEIRIRSTRFPCSLCRLLFKKYERIEQELAEAAEKSKLQNAIETKGEHGHEARISSSVPL